jgi:hypothetical protein
MNKFKLMFNIMILLLASGMVRAQVLPAPMVQMPEDSKLINGREHPEQITDAVIFRMWAGDFVRDYRPAHMSNVDEQVLFDVLTRYHAHLKALLNAQRGDEDIEGTIYQLVGNALRELQIRMSPIGMLNFHSFLEEQKDGARVSIYDVGLGASAQLARKELNMVASAGGQGPPGMTSNYSGFATFSYTNGIAAENFMGETALTSNWVAVPGPGGVTHGWIWYKGNLVANGYESKMYYATGMTDYTNGCAFINLGPSNTRGSAMAAIRVRPSGDAYWSQFFPSDNYNDGYVYIGRTLAGSESFIATGAPYISAKTGDKLGVCAWSDGTVQAYYNGVKVASLNDHNAVPSGYPGVFAHMGTVNKKTGVNTSPQIVSWTGTSQIHFNISAQITGNTICTGTTCNGVIHTPHVQNQSTHYGGTVYGAGVTPQTSVGITNNVAYPQDESAGNPGDIIIDVGISCTAVGNFFNQLVGGGGVPPPGTYQGFENEIAFTELQTTGAGTPGIWNANEFCTPPTVPPDHNPLFVYDDLPVPEPWYEGTGDCVRYTEITRHWFCIGEAEPDPAPTGTGAVCSNCDRGYPGLILWPPPWMANINPACVILM